MTAAPPDGRAVPSDLDPEVATLLRRDPGGRLSWVIDRTLSGDLSELNY